MMSLSPQPTTEVYGFCRCQVSSYQRRRACRPRSGAVGPPWAGGAP
jgi:hypothetical protein